MHIAFFFYRDAYRNYKLEVAIQNISWRRMCGLIWHTENLKWMCVVAFTRQRGACYDPSLLSSSNYKSIWYKLVRIGENVEWEEQESGVAARTAVERVLDGRKKTGSGSCSIRCPLLEYALNLYSSQH
jgi:hypothetical protein